MFILVGVLCETMVATTCFAAVYPNQAFVTLEECQAELPAKEEYLFKLGYEALALHCNLVPELPGEDA
jgi:hypothetical protein